MKSHYNRIWVVLLIIFGSLFADAAIANVATTVLFQPPSEEEQPQETEGAASRQLGECSPKVSSEIDIASNSPNLMPLSPQRNYGLTAMARPNFWFYLPPTSATKAILSLKKKGNVSPHWQQSIELTPEAGIVGIQLAANAPALEIGENYQWAIILVCGDRPSPNDPVITSWIRRIEESDIVVDAATPELEKAAVYARKGIWYDALNLLLTERSPSANWRDVWQQYLASGGLENLAQRPIIGNLTKEEH